jgi:hypothetical protein
MGRAYVGDEALIVLKLSVASWFKNLNLIFVRGTYNERLPLL